TGWKSNDWVLSNDAGAAPLVGNEPIGDEFGFVFDVRLKEDSGAPLVQIGGLDLAIDRTDPTLKELLEETGKWNRFEGSLKAARLTISVNGKPWQTDLPISVPLRTPSVWKFVPAGPTDWANPYLRKLED
ncbi:MAG: hypothetical protein KDM64_12990, partial [Verrucomicrobiae bacterium]|nr:hypothetical protein [Verrucomicrobiae bacterium]